MPNDIKLGNSKPVDSHLRPLKVAGEPTSIEVTKIGNGARVTGDLEVKGDVYLENIRNCTTIDSDGEDFTINLERGEADSATFILRSLPALSQFEGNFFTVQTSYASGSNIGTSLYLRAYPGSGASVGLTVTEAGAVGIVTSDGAGTNNADLTITTDGYIMLKTLNG